MKENKIWGNTIKLWTGNNVEVHRICIDPDCFCSKHKHEHKYNFFFVEKGELEISIWRDNGIIDKTILKDGEASVVEPGVYHMFTSNKYTEALEIYSVVLNEDDIIRENVGGRKEKTNFIQTT